MSKRMLWFLSVFSFTLYSAIYFIVPPEAEAICPVCTVAVGAGLGLSRVLGIDDAVTSVWIGGLILSMSFWFIDWIGKKRNRSLATGYRVLAILSFYLLTLLPLYFGKLIGRPYNTFIGIDKIMFGTFWGSLAFESGRRFDAKVRQIKGKQLFVYQKVVFPVLALLLTSLILHFVVGS